MQTVFTHFFAHSLSVTEFWYKIKDTLYDVSFILRVYQSPDDPPPSKSPPPQLPEDQDESEDKDDPEDQDDPESYDVPE